MSDMVFRLSITDLPFNIIILMSEFFIISPKNGDSSLIKKPLSFLFNEDHFLYVANGIRSRWQALLQLP